MKRNRKSYRLKNWDYRNDGLYFITICTIDRQHYFGKIKNQKMVFSPCGAIADVLLFELPHRNPNVSLGEYIIMPNHIHVIIQLENNNSDTDDTDSNIARADDAGTDDAGTDDARADDAGRDDARADDAGTDVARNIPIGNIHTKNERMSSISPKPNSISTIIRSYKSAVTKHCNRLNLPFQWQSRFHDHIIRNDQSFQNISNYIINNPENWTEDQFNT